MKKMFSSMLFPLVEGKIEGLTKETLDSLIEIPQDLTRGDFAIPCFQFAKVLRKAPQMIASELAGDISADFIERTEAVSGYLNFFVNRSVFAARAFEEISAVSVWGADSCKGKKALIEHTSINPNASPHLGRARNAFIGDAVARLLRFLGYDTEVHYFVNDIGKQISMLVYALKDREDITFDMLLSEYVKVNDELKEHPEIETIVFDQLAKLEGGDKEMTVQFRRIVDICMEGQKALFSEIGIKYDFFDYESQYIVSGRTDEVIEKLRATGRLSEDENGREVLDLGDYGFEQKILPVTRADKTSLYPLRDICYSLDKASRGKDVNLIILGEDQTMYGKQINAALDVLGEKGAEIINYSFVLLSTGKMSTRQGKVVMLSDVMEQVAERAAQQLEERNGVRDMEKAKSIGYGAMKYAMLKCGYGKNVLFDWDMVLNMQGDSSLYLQYNYARIMSLCRKYADQFPGSSYDTPDTSMLASASDWELLKAVYGFRELLAQLPENGYPVANIANYLYSLAQQYSKWYFDNPILTNDNKAVTDARMWLSVSVAQVIKSGLGILGIDVVESM